MSRVGVRVLTVRTLLRALVFGAAVAGIGVVCCSARARRYGGLGCFHDDWYQFVVGNAVEWLKWIRDLNRFTSVIVSLSCRVVFFMGGVSNTQTIYSIV